MQKKRKREKRSKSAPSLTPGHPVEQRTGVSPPETHQRRLILATAVAGWSGSTEVEDIGDDTCEGREQARTPLLRHRHARDHRPQAVRTRNDERGRREREGWREEEEEA